MSNGIFLAYFNRT